MEMLFAMTFSWGVTVVSFIVKVYYFFFHRQLTGYTDQVTQLYNLKPDY